MLTFMTQIDNLFLVQKTIIPRLKSWIRKVVLEEEDDSVMKTNTKLSLAEEAAAAAKAAAAAAADVARASQEMLNSKNEGGIVI
jgi:peroxin-14